jgi:hypothetical protein
LKFVLWVGAVVYGVVYWDQFALGMAAGIGMTELIDA